MRVSTYMALSMVGTSFPRVITILCSLPFIIGLQLVLIMLSDEDSMSVWLKFLLAMFAFVMAFMCSLALRLVVRYFFGV